MPFSNSIAAALLFLFSFVAATRFKFYDYPKAVSGPCDLCVGPDKAIWTSDILSATIGRIEPHTGKLEQYNIPYTRPAGPLSLLPGRSLPQVLEGRSTFACAIRTGADGHIWASSGIRDQLVRIDPYSKNMTILTPSGKGPVPPGGSLGNIQPFNDLQTNDDGMYFSSTTANTISHYNYKTGKYKNWDVPTKLSSPLGMRLAKDNSLWFLEFVGQKVARLNATSGHIHEYPVPAGLLAPAVMRATIGKHLYFTAAVGNGIGRIDTTNGALKAYHYPPPLSVVGVNTKDSHNNVWFSTFTRNSIGKLNPFTGKFTSFKFPKATTRLPLLVSISVQYHRGTNSIFFSETTANRVGQYFIGS